MKFAPCAAPIVFLIASSWAPAADSPANAPPANAPRAAILDEPSLPRQGAPSSPEVLAAILETTGLAADRLSAEALADPQRFSAARYDLVVIPTGPVFPAAARTSLLDFLKRGGSLIATGGYAFHHLVRKVDGQWVPEIDLLRARRDEATSRARSLLPNGGFESSAIPIGGFSSDGQWRRAGEACQVVADSPREGRLVAKTHLSEATQNQGAHFWLDLPPRPGASYQVSGWMRSENVAGPGMAYMAMYQHDKADALVEFRDFAVARGNTDWTRYEFTFTPKPNVARLHLVCGFFRAWGTAWFDDLRLSDVTGLTWQTMDTSSGTPADGLITSPDQLGMFDASYPLKRAVSLRVTPGQLLLQAPLGAADISPNLSANLSGWAASGVIGANHARWVPLLETRDRFGRPRGPAGAMLMHYDGPFAGSCWAYFGLENLDLFADAHGAMAAALQDVARCLVRKTFLHSFSAEQRLYRADEPVRVLLTVENRGKQPAQAMVEIALADATASPPPANPLATSSRVLELPPGTAQRLTFALPPVTAGASLCSAEATLYLKGRPVDRLVTGFVVEQPDALRSAPPLGFAGNYFTLAGRPTFLFGSDTYSVVYQAASENPLTWSDELAAARDMGMNLYEILQPTNPRHVMTDADWRNVAAFAQLVQTHGMVFMPGILIGHNVAVSDAELASQSELCRQYARRLGRVPSLLWYLNGDYFLETGRDPQAVRALWQRWLAAEYSTPQMLRAAWGAIESGTARKTRATNGSPVLLGQKASNGSTINNGINKSPDSFEKFDYPPPDSGRWDDAAAADQQRFLASLTARWNRAHAAAVREHDASHPITSEYYSMPMNGIDLVRTIDGQDVSNFGFFDKPDVDLEQLPLRIRWNDLRARGKGVSLGEYGVKTHPAWSAENGAQDYHLVRSEDEQKQLFLAVGHYALGLGACKVQNWCLRDDPTRVFPWGIFYPNQLVPKDVAGVHRNQSLVWRHFQPVYRPASLAVCLANSLRAGNEDRLGTQVAYRTFADLLALHYDFQAIDDDHLEQIPAETRVLIAPTPLAMTDEAYACLRAWVRRGGTLLVTGDFSRDGLRRRTSTGRLQELAGVEFVAETWTPPLRASAPISRAEFHLPGLGPHSVRPCLRVKAVGGEVLGTTEDGRPVLIRKPLGRGATYFFTDPIELGDDPQAIALRRALYASVLRAATQGGAAVKPLAIEPDEPWLHVMTQPTAQATVHVVYNTRRNEGSCSARLATAAGRVELGIRNRWPALAAATRQGRLVAVTCHGTASVDGTPIVRGDGFKALLALDREDLRRSAAVLVAPFETGTLELPARPGQFVLLVGDFDRGRWRTLQRLPTTGDKPTLAIDPDVATSLVLVCPAAEEAAWTNHLSAAMLHPESLAGY